MGTKSFILASNSTILSLRLPTSFSLWSSLHLGQMNFTLGYDTSRNACFDSPAHFLWSHELQSPSQKIESCPLLEAVASIIPSSQTGYIEGIAGLSIPVALACCCFTVFFSFFGGMTGRFQLEHTEFLASNSRVLFKSPG